MGNPDILFKLRKAISKLEEIAGASQNTARGEKSEGCLQMPAFRRLCGLCTAVFLHNIPTIWATQHSSIVHLYTSGFQLPRKLYFDLFIAVRNWNECDLTFSSWQDAEMPNNILTDAIRNFLFKKPGKFFGSDLAARNIQRGRDHELGSYNSYRYLFYATGQAR